MSLPDRTLCWVEGPPWDRYCTPVEEGPIPEPLDRDILRERLARLDEEELGVVLAMLLSRLDEAEDLPLPTFLRHLADSVEARIAEKQSESSGYVCGSNYCDDPACEMEHDERL